MSRITIDIPDEAEKDLEKHRKELYPHCTKLSRMMLEISMEDVRKTKLKKGEE